MNPDSKPAAPRAWLNSALVPGGPWPAALVDEQSAIVFAPREVLAEPPADLHLLVLDDVPDDVPDKAPAKAPGKTRPRPRGFSAVESIDIAGTSAGEERIAGMVRLRQPLAGVAPEVTLEERRRNAWTALELTGALPEGLREREAPAAFPQDPIDIPVTDRPAVLPPGDLYRPLFCVLFPWFCMPHDGGGPRDPAA